MVETLRRNFFSPLAKIDNNDFNGKEYKVLLRQSNSSAYMMSPPPARKNIFLTTELRIDQFFSYAFSFLRI